MAIVTITFEDMPDGNVKSSCIHSNIDEPEVTFANCMASAFRRYSKQIEDLANALYALHEREERGDLPKNKSNGEEKWQ